MSTQKWWSYLYICHVENVKIVQSLYRMLWNDINPELEPCRGVRWCKKTTKRTKPHHYFVLAKKEIFCWLQTHLMIELKLKVVRRKSWLLVCRVFIKGATTSVRTYENPWRWSRIRIKCLTSINKKRTFKTETKNTKNGR